MPESVPEESHPLSNEALLAPFRRIPRADWVIIGWTLAIKVLLFVFGWKCFQILSDQRPKNAHAWLELWSRWDALRILQIVEQGYQANNLHAYPLFPWLTRFFAQLTGDPLVAALLLATLASFAAPLLFRRLLELDYPPRFARNVIWFFLIFPTAYFLHVGYTEGLFLTLVFGAFLAARKDIWWLAGLLGALAAMTRAAGMALVAALVAEVVYQFVKTKRWQWRWLWVLIVPLGFGVYLWTNAGVTGNPFAFLQTRKQVFYTSITWPWAGLRELIGNLRRTPSQAEMVGAQELYFVLLGFAASIWSWFRLRPMYAMWATANWIGMTSQTFVQSTPRFTFVIFPIFILFAFLSRRPFWNCVIVVWSLLFLALFTSLYVRGWWAF